MTRSRRTRRANGASGASVSGMGIADLERRTITAVVYGVVVIAALFAPSPTFAVLVAVLAVLGYLELRSLFRGRSYQPWLVGVVFVLLFIGAHLLGGIGQPSELTVWTLLATALLGAVAILVFVVDAALRRRRTPNVLGALFTLAGGCTRFLFACLVIVGSGFRRDARLVSSLRCGSCSRSCDLGGRHHRVSRRAPDRAGKSLRGSPGKTWEGLWPDLPQPPPALIIATSPGIDPVRTPARRGTYRPVVVRLRPPRVGDQARRRCERLRNSAARPGGVPRSHRQASSWSRRRGVRALDRTWDVPLTLRRRMG